jgi:hypothetical protein
MASFARVALCAPRGLMVHRRLAACATILILTSPATSAGHPPQSYRESPEIVHGPAILWHDPGPVEQLDLRYGAGGASEAPQPPFQFVKEDTSGTKPKILVRDANQRVWSVKFGKEGPPDTFCTRLAWALGYIVEPNYFVRSATVAGVHDLKRARSEIDPDGSFTSGARFQLRSKDPEYLAGWSWSWNNNPFLGTPEFNGLRILTMLVSNWDNKDLRDETATGPVARYHELIQRKIRGSNNAIYRDADGRYLFFIDDWGAAMGSWGDAAERSKWDYAGYTAQSKQFVRVKDGRLVWGYQGIHTPDMMKDIDVSDVRWLMEYLGRISDAQLRNGLLSSGATADEAYCFTMALRMRIEELRDIAQGQAVTRAR